MSLAQDVGKALTEVSKLLSRVEAVKDRGSAHAIALGQVREGLSNARDALRVAADGAARLGDEGA